MKHKYIQGLLNERIETANNVIKELQMIAEKFLSNNFLKNLEN